MKHFKSVQYKAREASGSGSIPRDGSVRITRGAFGTERSRPVDPCCTTPPPSRWPGPAGHTRPLSSPALSPSAPSRSLQACPDLSRPGTRSALASSRTASFPGRARLSDEPFASGFQGRARGRRAGTQGEQVERLFLFIQIYKKNFINIWYV